MSIKAKSVSEPARPLTGLKYSKSRETMEDMVNICNQANISILAAGIAHDFNNLLSIITGNISLAKLSIDEPEKISKTLNVAEKACHQAAELTQQLLAFVRMGAPVKKTSSLKSLIRDTASFSLCGSNIICVTNIADDLWSVNIDCGQISQVINNLVINAIQAMPEGGKIQITAENCVFQDASDGLAPGNYVCISVKDEGIGIPEEYIKSIFDPYFSTKDEGNGLGLTSCYAIIKNHDGDIKVQSTVNQGTAFYVYLPASKETAVDHPEPESNLIQGRGVVLIMDDEDQVRVVTALMLEALGYQVLEAKTGEEAVRIYQEQLESGINIDAVIIDLTVQGGMGGCETISRLKEMDPEVKAILSSGYSNDPIFIHHTEWGFKGVIAKPYGIKELNEVLSSVIAK